MVAASRRRRAEAVVVGEVRRGWRTYGWGGLVAERRYGAPGLGLRGGLQEWFRGGSGAGVREVLGCVKKGFSSWVYREVPSPEIEGARNLTGDLTEPLPARLTPCLPRGLTESWVREVRAGGQTGSGDHREAVTTLGLGSLQDF